MVQQPVALENGRDQRGFGVLGGGDGVVEAEGRELAQVGSDLAVAVGFALVPVGAEVGDPGVGVGEQVPVALCQRLRRAAQRGCLPVECFRPAGLPAGPEALVCGAGLEGAVPCCVWDGGAYGLQVAVVQAGAGAALSAWTRAQRRSPALSWKHEAPQRHLGLGATP